MASGYEIFTIQASAQTLSPRRGSPHDLTYISSLLPPHSPLFPSQRWLPPEMFVPLFRIVCKVPKDKNLISFIPCYLPSTQNGAWHWADTQPIFESTNEWINSPGRGASTMDEKRRMNHELLLSELWPMEPHATAHSLHPVLHSNGTEGKEPPNQNPKVGGLEATALQSSKDDMKLLSQTESCLWTNGCNLEDPQD